MSQTSVERAKSVWNGTQGAADADGLISRVIDNDPHLLEQSYHLRYQVYCLERGFLPAADYPEQREVDEFDAHAIHVGVLNTMADVVGTARLVKPSPAGLPLFQHCSLFEDAPSLDDGDVRVIEASRLAISREYNRRPLTAGDAEVDHRAYVAERRKANNVVLNIFKGFYQASKRGGFTHWLAATEKSLQRLMSKYGFPWKPVGPETDYYGCVSPYLMNLREFDEVILSGRNPMLHTFLDGLEPEFSPLAEFASVKEDVWADLVDAMR